MSAVPASLPPSTDEFVGLLAAPDASERELRRLSSRLGVEWTTRLFSAEELGRVFGRDSLAFVGVHAGRSKKLAESLRRDMDRLGGLFCLFGLSGRVIPVYHLAQTGDGAVGRTAVAADRQERVLR